VLNRQLFFQPADFHITIPVPNSGPVKKVITFLNHGSFFSASEVEIKGMIAKIEQLA
jgi:hypothetical protein